MHIYFVINRTFYKKNSINKPRLLKKLVEWFQAVSNMLRALRNAHPGAYLERGIVPCHTSSLGRGTNQKKCKIYLEIA